MLRKGGYNIAFVNSDGSYGVHNPVYTVNMLQQSIEFLNPGSAKLARMHMLRSHDMLATNFK